MSTVGDFSYGFKFRSLEVLYILYDLKHIMFMLMGINEKISSN